MNCNDQGTGTTLPPWRVATVHGEPYQVAGYRLTPVARVLTYAVGQGTLRSRSTSGWAAGLVHVRPLAILVERDGNEQRISLASSTAVALAIMIAAGVVVTFLLWAVRLLARRRRRRAERG